MNNITNSIIIIIQTQQTNQSNQIHVISIKHQSIHQKISLTLHKNQGISHHHVESINQKILRVS